jgi:hypothetical protein
MRFEGAAGTTALGSKPPSDFKVTVVAVDDKEWFLEFAMRSARRKA